MSFGLLNHLGKASHPTIKINDRLYRLQFEVATDVPITKTNYFICSGTFAFVSSFELGESENFKLNGYDFQLNDAVVDKSALALQFDSTSTFSQNNSWQKLLLLDAYGEPFPERNWSADQFSHFIDAQFDQKDPFLNARVYWLLKFGPTLFKPFTDFVQNKIESGVSEQGAIAALIQKINAGHVLLRLTPPTLYGKSGLCVLPKVSTGHNVVISEKDITDMLRIKKYQQQRMAIIKKAVTGVTVAGLLGAFFYWWYGSHAQE